MEIDNGDPGGHTSPYRILVPALWAENQPEMTAEPQFKGRRASLMDRIMLRLGRDREVGDGAYSRSPSPSPPPSAGTAQHAGADPNDSVEAHVGPAKAPHHREPEEDVSDDITDDVTESEDNVPSAPSGNAFDKGYNLASPPIGSHQTRSDHAQPGARRG